MTMAAKTLQFGLIRHLRGLLAEWEKWLQSQEESPSKA